MIKFITRLLQLIIEELLIIALVGVTGILIGLPSFLTLGGVIIFKAYIITRRDAS